MNSDKSGYYDYSTLNLEALKRLPIHKKPPTYSYQRGPGNSCAGDAPGFPTFFTRSVYTRHGNYPGRGAVMVIIVPGLKPRIVETADWRPGENWDARHARFQQKLRKLWKPLPLDHPRVRMWIKSQYRHLNSCYVDTSKAPRNSDRIIIWPVPDYELDTFVDDKRFSDEWREKEKAVIAQKNAETIAYYRQFVRPDNHQAVLVIQKFYPEHKPEEALIDNPVGEARDPDWWERYAVQPTPEQCAGMGGVHSHPIGNPCQTCGHVIEEKAS